MAWRSAYHSRRVTVRVAELNDTLQQYDVADAEYRANFSSYFRQTADLTVFGGHISIRSMRARAESALHDLLISLETPEISALPSAREVTREVNVTWEISRRLYDQIVDLEHRGNFGPMFDEMVGDRDSLWNQKRHELHPAVKRPVEADRQLLKDMRKARQQARQALVEVLRP